MKINDLEFFLVRLGSDAPQPAADWVLARLATASGLEGWGEARLGWRAAELPARRDMLLSVIAGRSVFDVEELLALEVLRDPALRSAVEMASWDLVGRVTRQPLYNLFGGGYRQRIPLVVRLAGRSADDVASLARELAEQGFHSQVVTSSGRPEEDRKTLAAVRQSVGERAELQLDGRACYNLETARDLCAELECEGLRCFLDPIQAHDLFEVAILGRQTGVPLAVGRLIHGPVDVLRLARTGAARFVVLDLARVGGMVAARKCAAVAEAAGMVASLVGEPSPGLGMAASLHLAASTPALSGCDEAGLHQRQDELLADPLEIIDGMMTVPQGPGLGVEVDRAKIERCQIA